MPKEAISHLPMSTRTPAPSASTADTSDTFTEAAADTPATDTSTAHESISEAGVVPITTELRCHADSFFEVAVDPSVQVAPEGVHLATVWDGDAEDTTCLNLTNWCFASVWKQKENLPMGLLPVLTNLPQYHLLQTGDARHADRVQCQMGTVIVFAFLHAIDMMLFPEGRDPSTSYAKHQMAMIEPSDPFHTSAVEIWHIGKSMAEQHDPKK